MTNLRPARFVRTVIVAALAFLISVVSMTPARAQTAVDAVEAVQPNAAVACPSSAAAKITAVSDPAVRVTSTDFPAFDPTPLLSLTFRIGGTAASCVAAHFSTMQGAQQAYGRRLWTMYRVELDGVPMQSHYPLFSGPVAVGHTADNDLEMVAYNFWQRVPAGTHTIRVLFSGFGSGGSPGTLVVAPVLTVEHK
jgi:hypothetical protein